MSKHRTARKALKYVAPVFAATLCNGTAIGHRRIEQIEPVEIAAVRLVCTEDVAPPILRQLAVCPPA